MEPYHRFQWPEVLREAGIVRQCARLCVIEYRRTEEGHGLKAHYLILRT